MIVTAQAYARAGLAGNPSDGYFGRVVAVPLRNFSARVTLWDSDVLHIVPSPHHDPRAFDSLADLAGRAQRLGYYGGIRLLLATCKRFWDYCEQHGVKLPERNFTLSYSTDIPRQVGLGGSSAIIVAALKALLRFYGLAEEDLPLPVMPGLALSVEREELMIAGGLQDRVVQVYDRLVYMDFAEEVMARQGYGTYEPLEWAVRPQFGLAMSDDTRESGRILSDLRFRWDSGDPEARSLLGELATCADAARQAIEGGDSKALGEAMRRNFALRRRLLGDRVIGRESVEMVEIAESLGIPAKLPGSGGSVISLLGNEEQAKELAARYEAAGYRFVRVVL